MIASPTIRRLALNLSMSSLLGVRLRRAMLIRIGLPLQPDSKISRGTRIGDVWLTFGAGFGANEECWFDAHTHFGDNVRVGPRVSIFTAGHERGGPRKRRGDRDVSVPVTIGNGVWLQGDCTIRPGVDVASGCIVGVGAVITADTAPNGFYAGNPAVRIADLDDGGGFIRIRTARFNAAPWEQQ